MALKTLVKVGEITNLSDARYCAGMGVEMLGFNLNPHAESYISPEQFREITEWVAGVKFVGELENVDEGTFREALSDYPVDLVQITSAQSSLIFDIDLPVILSISSKENALGIMEKIGEGVGYYLLDSHFDQAANASGKFPLLLGGPINPQNVIQLLEKSDIKGIALKGSVEEKPGFKDYDQLADILEALEIDD